MAMPSQVGFAATGRMVSARDDANLRLVFQVPGFNFKHQTSNFKHCLPIPFIPFIPEKI